MSTCEDCLHYVVCKAVIGIPNRVGKNSVRVVKKDCPYNFFKDKFEWIHLPVKVGDAVYQPSYKFTKCSEHDYTPKYYDDSFCLGCESNCDSVEMPYVYKGTVCAIKITKGQTYLVVAFDEKFDSSNFILGKTVFLTREEAEKTLEDMRKEDEGK